LIYRFGNMKFFVHSLMMRGQRIAFNINYVRVSFQIHADRAVSSLPVFTYHDIPIAFCFQSLQLVRKKCGL